MCILTFHSSLVSPQVTAAQLSPSSSHKPSILILADSDQERNKWVGLLNELHRILKKNKLKERFVYVPKEAYDSTLPLIKTTQSAAIIGGPFSWKKKQNTKYLREKTFTETTRSKICHCIYMYFPLIPSSRLFRAIIS